MHMRAIADAIGFEHRRERRAMAATLGDGADEFAGQHCVIGGPEPDDWFGCDLVLAGPIFREE